MAWCKSSYFVSGSILPQLQNIYWHKWVHGGLSIVKKGCKTVRSLRSICWIAGSLKSQKLSTLNRTGCLLHCWISNLSKPSPIFSSMKTQTSIQTGSWPRNIDAAKWAHTQISTNWSYARPAEDLPEMAPAIIVHRSQIFHDLLDVRKWDRGPSKTNGLHSQKNNIHRVPNMTIRD